MRWIIIIALLIAAVLGYGYWHAKTHGVLNISIYDATQQTLFTPLKDVQISLLDASGEELAKGSADSQHGTIRLLHPLYGSCTDAEHNPMFSQRRQNAWQACFKIYSAWLMEWIDDVNYMDVVAGECYLRKLPVDVSGFTEDWWLWWVPHPHIGGRPYTYFKITLRVDPVACKILTNNYE